MSNSDEVVARKYRHALRDLTFNSKPIINNLTMLAHENIAHAPLIVKTLTSHLITVAPQLKLPTLYLIDSICKNVGGVYVGLFADEIMPAFSRAFDVLPDPRTKYQFLRVLGMWRGLFPEPLVRELEKRHGTAQDMAPAVAGSKRQASSNGLLRPELVLVLKDLKEALAKTDIDKRLLHDLDLRARSPDKGPLIDLIDSVTNVSNPMEKAPRVTPPQASHQQTTPQLNLNFPFTFDPNTLAALSPALSLLTSTSATGSAAAISPKLSTTAFKVQLTQEDINRKHPYLYRELYDALPLQCKNCGLRYPDTADGKARLEVHLDAHFRRNMKLKEVTKKVLTRDWFAREEDWILGLENLDMNKQVSVFEDATAAERDAESKAKALQSASEKIPAGDDHRPRTCSVCMDKIELYWDDDSDEWMLKGAAMLDDGVVVHAHCKPS